MKIIFEAPLNQLSFGNASYNILREFYKIQQENSKFEFGFFPMDNASLSAFDKSTPDFNKWLQSLINERFNNLDNDAITLKLWHINGAEKRLTRKQLLYSFYELDQPTSVEKKIVNLQDATSFSSEYAKNSFLDSGCKNVFSTPLGFDQDFFKTGKKYLDGKIHFLIMGKFEKRKHTDKIIKMWIKKFGNNPKYQLSLSIINPFLPQDVMKKIMMAYKGAATNINMLPYVGTNAEVNDILNSIDVDLSGLSGAEGWGLPAFNATCLGKWSVVLNATSHKDWATKDNCVLVEPSSKMEAYDGAFFKKGSDFNQGHIYNFDEDSAMQAIEKAATLAENKVLNSAGIETGQKFTYRNTVDNLCAIMSLLEQQSPSNRLA